MNITATYNVRYGNAYEKVIKVIESCKTLTQLMTAQMWVASIQEKFSENDVYIFVIKIHIQEKIISKIKPRSNHAKTNTETTHTGQTH